MLYRSFLVLLIILSRQISLANSAAPIIITGHPSSAPIISADDASVQREYLSIQCRFAVCNVQALYEIEARREMQLEFKFILPSNSQLKPSLNETALVVSQVQPITDAERKKWDSQYAARAEVYEQANLPPQKNEGPLFAAKFTGKVIKGTNRLVVLYTQAQQLHLQRSYVLRAASGEAGFLYILSPLKEWKQKKDFHLVIDVSWEQAKRNFWSKLFGSGIRKITCLGNEEKLQPTATRLEKNDQNEVQHFQFEFKESFPDTFKCVGDLSPELNGLYSHDVERLAEAFEREQVAIK